MAPKLTRRALSRAGLAALALPVARPAIRPRPAQAASAPAPVPTPAFTGFTRWTPRVIAFHTREDGRWYLCYELADGRGAEVAGSLDDGLGQTFGMLGGMIEAIAEFGEPVGV